MFVHFIYGLIIFGVALSQRAPCEWISVPWAIKDSLKNLFYNNKFRAGFTSSYLKYNKIHYTFVKSNCLQPFELLATKSNLKVKPLITLDTN